MRTKKNVIMRVEHLSKNFVIRSKKLTEKNKILHALSDVSFDIYEGEQIKAGYKSVAYSVTFRAKDRTLEDKDVSTVMEKIMKALSELGAELRA